MTDQGSAGRGWRGRLRTVAGGLSPSRLRSSAASKRRSRGAAELSVLVVTGSLVAGVFFGTGLSRTAVDVADGLTWLSDDENGQVIQVNPATGKLELKQVVGNPGDDIDVLEEHNGQLYVTDRTTGQLLAFDLTSILVSGQRRVSAGGAIDTLATEDGMFLVDSEQSTISAMDPQTTDVIGSVWIAPAGLADAAVDADGTIWAIEDNGVLHRLEWDAEQLALDDEDPQEVGGSGPGSVLVAHDRGVTVFSPDEGRAEQVGTDREVSADAPKVSGRVFAPESAPSGLVPVATDNGFVILLTPEGIIEVDMTPVACSEPGTPEVFRNEVFVPCRGEGRVVRLGPDGVRSNDDILTPGSRDPELVVDDDNLIVNAPGAAQGVVVHADGHTSAVVREDDAVEPVGLGSSSAPPPPPSPDLLDDLLEGLGNQPSPPSNPSNPSPPPAPPAPSDPPTLDPDGPSPTSPGGPATSGGNPGGGQTGGPRCDDTGGPGGGQGGGQGGGCTGISTDGPGPGATSTGGTAEGQAVDAPYSVVATPMPEGQVQVTWRHSGFPKADSFVIRSATGKVVGSYKGWVRQAFVDVVPGQSNTFTVTAILEDGEAVSLPSNAVTSTARPGAPVVAGTAAYEIDDEELRFSVVITWKEAAANGEPVTAYDVSVRTPDGTESQRTTGEGRSVSFEWTCDRRADAGCTVGGAFTASVTASSVLGTGAIGTTSGPAPTRPPNPLPDAGKQVVDPTSVKKTTADANGAGRITLKLKPADDWRRFPDLCAYEYAGTATPIACDARTVTITFTNGAIFEPASGVVEHVVTFAATNDGGVARSAAFKFTSEQPVQPQPTPEEPPCPNPDPTAPAPTCP
ncbi:hypothetical protein [Nocardioides sp. 1609]|uniref:hypothetical protein n=1 Tax=Nocardioides sp. 1609 TaxID=2508327 RepID=UPI00107002C3|nr:hypothetical protein [Nocardioides sp. 1609]